MSLAIPQHDTFDPSVLAGPFCPLPKLKILAPIVITMIDTLEARPAYQPEWMRPDSPTRSMSESELRAYYIANGPAGDCRFALRADSGVPADLQAVYRALLTDLERRKATPADKRVIAELRAAWRDATEGKAYRVPAYVSPVKAARKVSARLCPHCGGTL